MKTKDRIKEEIGLYKLLMTFAFAVFTSITSWFWNSANSFTFVINIMVGFLIISFFWIGLFLFIEINKKIKELDYD